MTTCTIQKFYNVKPLELAELMRLIGSEHNTGETPMWLAYKEHDGTFNSLRSSVGDGPPLKYRHISVLKAEPSEDMHGTFKVEVKINCFFEPAPGETRETADNGYHWTNRDDSAPVLVPRSLVDAMHEALGIFPAA